MKLMPCPFCWSTDLLSDDFNGHHFVICCECDTEGPVSKEKDNLEDAQFLWNTRPVIRSFED